ncbi:MAG: NAD(P)-binding domain-containing protein [Acidobacteria bacterium]|nr:NAD(P)-binding domain-containing protein [Acidobacteriota bacterium]
MSKPSVAVLGSGQVAQVLARGFKKHGYPVCMGNRDAAKLEAFSRETGIPAHPSAEAVRAAEIVVLAVKGTAAESVVSTLSAHLGGRVVLDAVNPIADVPPQNGVLRYFTGPNESLMERLQKLAPEARFVKAFNSVGNAFMVDPAFPGGRPTMFLAGNDPGAKAAAAAILEAFGWDAEDMGPAEAARPIEALCQLWCAPGFLRNQWTHAFKLLKL